MQPKRNVRVERSSGGVVVARRGGEPHVAMIATRERTRWGLPKGAPDDGETSAEAAVREVREETGLAAEVLAPLETIEYFFKAGGLLIHKFVDFFLMAYRGGELQPQLEEVDDAVWFPLSEALERSSYPSEKKILGQLAASWQAMTEEERARFDA
ncbi:MAG: NUDIX hydrolase [Thermoanaerobaculia bacterium]